MTNENLVTTVSNYQTTGGYYSPYGDWVPYSFPVWNPPVYIQPSYVTYPVYFYPDNGLTEEVKELRKEIKKLRKALDNGR